MNDEEKVKNTLPLWMESNLEFMWCISFIFGVIYILCLDNNLIGITYPLFVAAIYAAAIIIMRKMNIAIKRMSYFYIVISILLGITTFRTASSMIHSMNNIAIALLACTFVLHQTYDDWRWSIGKYTSSIIQYIFCSLGCLYYSFLNIDKLIKKLQQKKYKVIVLVLAGIVISIPLLLILVSLLAMADRVFSSLIDHILSSYLNLGTIIRIFIKFVAASFLVYAFICCAGLKKVKAEQIEKRNCEPILMITTMSMVGFIYLIFCGIQIFYLFLGRGVLPYHMTYAEYAREGFFQLLFVIFINLVMVLLCIKYFRESKILNIILTIISLCTYIMIASSLYRMMLYIGAYHLTRMRVLVLWFLVLISVLMIGVIRLIYQNKFPLFHYSICVIGVFYLLFAGMRPDYLIANYNYSHNGSIDIRNLSADALPTAVMAGLGQIEGVNSWKESDKIKFINKTCDSYGKMGIRRYNSSYAEVFKLREKYNENE